MNGIKTKIKVVGRQRWDMETEQKQRIKGAKIFVEAHVKDENREGLFPTTFNLATYDDYNKFYQIPAEYEVEMHMRAGSKGVFTIENVELVLDKGIKQ